MISRMVLMIGWVAMAAPAGLTAEVHVDAARGSDENPGTAAQPLQSIEAAVARATGGDTILLQPGEYGPIERRGGPGQHLFTERYVTIRPGPNVTDSRKHISIERVRFGVRSGTLTGEGRKGVFDLWLRVEGIRIVDGVYVYGGRHLEVSNCRIERVGPHVGSPENIEKFAVNFGAGDDLTVRDSQITHTAGGVILSGSRNRAVGCDIHDVTHDGVRCVSSKDSLVENCRIYNLDDGVDDGDPRGEGWNRHCDAVHIFIPGPGVDGAQNSRLTIRGNAMYNCESQAIQFNNYFRHKDLWNEDVVIENNVFGPTRANVVNLADPVDGIVFRNNTFVHFPEGRSFPGLGRTIHCENHTFRITPECKRAEVYNNILVRGTAGPQPGWFVGYNLLIEPRPTQPIGRFDLADLDPQFVDAAAMDGRLRPTSPAIDAGTRRYAPTPVHPTGIYGTERDARPDLGAVELAGRHPKPEPAPPTATKPVRVFLDDFRDGNLHEADPWLAGENTAGLAWRMVSADDEQAYRVERGDGRNALSEPAEPGLAMVATTVGDDWRDVDFHFTADNGYLIKGGGPVVLLRDAHTFYWLDISRDHGRLLRSLPDGRGGANVEQLAAAPAVQLPHHGTRSYCIQVRREPGAIVLRVDADANGTVDFEYRDESAKALEAMPGGRVGFRRDTKQRHHRIRYGDVRVEQASSSTPVPLRRGRGGPSPAGSSDVRETRRTRPA